MVALKSALCRVWTTKRKKLYLRQRLRFRKTRVRGIGKWEESSIVSGPKKLTFLSGNIITTPCYILEQGEEREWGRKILPFYRLQLRHLTAFDKIKWDNHVSGSFTIGIMRKCISFFFFILINIIILFTDFISFSHVFFRVCSWKF